MFKNIIVPVDGSAPSTAAVQLALRLAREQRAMLTFAHAMEITKNLSMMAPRAAGYAIEAARAAGNEVLDQAKAEAADSGLTVSTELLEGECVNALLDFATQRKADLIVVGSHGRGGISRALLGSVAEGILRRSKIPVLVTHAAENELKHSATEAPRVAGAHTDSH